MKEHVQEYIKDEQLIADIRYMIDIRLYCINQQITQFRKLFETND